MGIELTHLVEPTGDLLEFEVVERKGLGHPDTICDHLAEELSQRLSQYYLEKAGQVLHYNADKALLWGGSARPRFGGGTVDQPAELFIAGRATTAFGGSSLALDELADGAVRGWLNANVPSLHSPERLKLHCLVRPGSADLTQLLAQREQKGVLSNDTSCGFGYAPLSRLERAVLAIEQRLGALAGTRCEIGRDIKVMGVRRGERAHLTISCALVDRHVADATAYEEVRRFLAATAEAVAAEHRLWPTVQVNAADDPPAQSYFLTVTGCSAENGDDGQAGRGNRVNGLITPMRPMTMESVAGKNAANNVGKLYNVVASLIAQRLVQEVPGIAECECWLVSTIGRRVWDPQSIAIRAREQGRDAFADQRSRIRAIAEDELERLAILGSELASRRITIGTWPLRAETWS